MATRRTRAGDGEPLVQILDESGDLVAPLPEGLSDDDLVEMYQQMRRLRILDQRMIALQRQGRISFYGSATGQEGAVVGTGWAFEERDWIVPALREGGIALLRGYPLDAYIAQCFGTARDALAGRQMPCHYSDPEHHYVSLSSPIGTQIPQAVGVAMAAQIRGDGVVVGCYMGDGATSEGDFQAGVQLAALRRAPVVLVCQNNQWAISVPASRQTASRSFAAKGRAWGMRAVRVDGNDVLACFEVTRQAVQRARAGEGPTFVEALTYRVGAHSTSDDPSRYRDERITEEWKTRRCPVLRMRRLLEARGLWSAEQEAEFTARVEAQIKELVARHEAAGRPALETMFEDVYATMPWHLREQRDAALAEQQED